MTEQYKKWEVQFRKGLLEICVLQVLSKNGAMHGAALTDYFASLNLHVNEGTIYPILNRMQMNGWIHFKWSIPEKRGHPKKIYQINAVGERTLSLMIQNYQKHHKSFKKIGK